MDMYQDRPSWKKNPIKRLKHNRMLDKRKAYRDLHGDPDVAMISKGKHESIAESVKNQVSVFFNTLGE